MSLTVAITEPTKFFVWVSNISRTRIPPVAPYKIEPPVTLLSQPVTHFRTMYLDRV